MSAFEKNRYIFDQSIWKGNCHFDHWFSIIKSFLCGVWNLGKEKLQMLEAVVFGNEDFSLYNDDYWTQEDKRNALAHL